MSMSNNGILLLYCGELLFLIVRFSYLWLVLAQLSSPTSPTVHKFNPCQSAASILSNTSLTSVGEWKDGGFSPPSICWLNSAVKINFSDNNITISKLLHPIFFDLTPHLELSIKQWRIWSHNDSLGILPTSSTLKPSWLPPSALWHPPRNLFQNLQTPKSSGRRCEYFEQTCWKFSGILLALASHEVAMYW